MTQPETSLQARNATKKTLPKEHRQKILEALEVIKYGNFEAIAKQAKLTPHQVARRLKELEGDTLKGLPIFVEKHKYNNYFIKQATKSGHLAYCYCLV